MPPRPRGQVEGIAPTDGVELSLRQPSRFVALLGREIAAIAGLVAQQVDGIAFVTRDVASVARTVALIADEVATTRGTIPIAAGAIAQLTRRRRLRLDFVAVLGPSRSLHQGAVTP